MDRTQKITLISLTALAAVVVILKARAHPSVATPANGEDPFMTPYSWNTPGIQDSNSNLFGSSGPFVSNVNLSVNPSYLATLSQTYIPMFGFVGVGVGAPGGQIQNQIVPPPPPASYGTGSFSNSVSVAPTASTFNQGSPFVGSGIGGPQMAANPYIPQVHTYVQPAYQFGG